MTDFTLNLDIDTADLQTIDLAGELITIVFGVTAFVTSANKSIVAQPALVWLTFAPFQSNVITFSDDGFLAFAASAVPAPGAVLQMGSTAPAAQGMAQAFQAGGTFGPPYASPGLGLNDFAIDNQYPSKTGYMVFGLALAATVNGVSVTATPLIARVTPTMQRLQLSPNNGVQVFLQSNTQNAMVLPNSIANVPIHILSTAQPTLSLKYNAQTASFQ